MIGIEGQPLVFNICDECNCGGTRCQSPSQIARFSDKFSFQATDIQYFLGEELLVTVAGAWYGDFESGALAPDWGNDLSIGTNPWAINNVSPLAGSYDVDTIANSRRLYNLVPIGGINGRWYRLNMLHDDFGDPCTLSFYISSDAVTWTLVTTFDDNSEIPFDFQAVRDVNYIGFVLNTVSGCEGDWAMDNISLKEIDVDTWTVNKCCEGDFVMDLDDSKFEVTGGNFVFTDRWDNYTLTPGYYKLCNDDVQLFKNSSFTASLADWDQTGIGETWVWNGGRAEVTLLLLGDESKILSQDVNLPACSYELNIDLNAGDGVNLLVYVNEELEETFVNPGATVQTVSLDYDFEIESIGIRFVDTTGGGTWAVNGLSILKDICTNCVELAEDFDCSLWLEATQTNDAFNFDFTDFTMYMRVYADLWKGALEFDRQISQSSSDLFSRVFTQYNDLKELKIYTSPRVVWSALGVMGSLRTFKVNGVTHVFKEGNWELDWDEKSENASGALEIYKAQQSGVNSY